MDRNGAELTISTLAERPALAEALWGMQNDWPEFVLRDPVGWLLVGRIVAELPEYVPVATDEHGEVVARGFSVPFALDRPGRGELPPGGWDQVLLWAFSDLRHGVAPGTVSAVEVTVAPGMRGRGISGRMVAALRDNARVHGFAELVAPVRPNAKHLEAAVPMEQYARRVREDGLPHDPWLRVHARAGGRIASIAPASMTVSGSLAQWREWTGLPFDAPGPVHVAGGLSPVRCEPAEDYAVYVEPNVWVRHPL